MEVAENRTWEKNEKGGSRREENAKRKRKTGHRQNKIMESGKDQVAEERRTRRRKNIEPGG